LWIQDTVRPMYWRPTQYTLFLYTTLFRSIHQHERDDGGNGADDEPADDGPRHARHGSARIRLLGRDVSRCHGRIHDGLSVQRLDGEEEGQARPDDRTAGGSRPTTRHEIGRASCRERV